MGGSGILFIYFPRRPGGIWGAYRCGAEPMGANLAAVRERGVLGPRGVHRIGSGVTVPKVQNKEKSSKVIGFEQILSNTAH